MKGSIVVVGAGAAGTAAAWSARKSGASVTVIRGRAGASELAGGALDDVPWTDAREFGQAASAEVEALVAELARELDVWELSTSTSGPARIATAGGVIRPCRGHDKSLLDLTRVEPGLVMLPRAARAGWDADALAAAFEADAWARERRLRFRAVDATLLRLADERVVSDIDLAARHDADARIEWLATRLREAAERVRGVSAVLIGPWLGARAPRAAAVSQHVGVPVGEVLAGVGTPAGLRFASARDRLLSRAGITVVDGWAEAVERRGSNSRALGVRLESGEVLAADHVVLAIGGVAAGGIVYAPPDHEAGEDLPPAVGVGFETSVAADVELGARGERLGVVSSMHGPDLDEIAWPTAGAAGLLESVGIRCHGTIAAPGISVAGDAIADRPRTMLEALASGIQAGLFAASASEP